MNRKQHRVEEDKRYHSTELCSDVCNTSATLYEYHTHKEFLSDTLC